MLHTRRQDLVSRVVDGEVLILDRVEGRVHRLNQTASYIWNACDRCSVDEIADHMAAQFDATPDVVLNDVRSTLTQLQRLGLVVEARGDNAETRGATNG